MACIAGAIAEPFYGGVPAAIADQILDLLDRRLRRTIADFRRRFPLGGKRPL
jgi:ADP-ribosylglycohydrolase